MNNGPVTVEKIVIEDEMNYRDTPVLHYKIEYPQFHDPDYQNALDSINRWYRQRALDLQREYETGLYREAAELYDDSIANNFPFHMYDAATVYEITYNQDGLLSLYTDDYVYSGGAHGGTVRHSETWNIKNACRIYLYQYTGDPAAFRAEILKEIGDQIALQIQQGENMYFEDYPQLISEHFNPESFYLTPDGLVIYYQQYDIAPYASGMPEFIITL
ncbi:MAG TPA: DUF3298 and DUF4163 domain-containing protein [Anaerovoracaceae bacterium]|nr:DUF3298 and DUF4163 domain-containing protein [Anaerovoracaceae bacterium]